VFESVEHVREVTETRLGEYNEERPAPCAAPHVHAKGSRRRVSVRGSRGIVRPTCHLS
jgi:hypothetical protein